MAFEEQKVNLLWLFDPLGIENQLKGFTGGKDETNFHLPRLP
jgi:hypothetical protein